MKAIFPLFLLLTLLLTFVGFADDSRLPQIVCRDARGNDFPLKLEKFAIEVDVVHDLAETTLTLAFRNETNRQLEGDFLLPLPSNTQISGYALEVNGNFREAVAVEKERAKLAYETIKSRRKDPGIVEKEADNLYRTRIFPIEPKSTKSLRISYLEYLPREDNYPSYRYPFNFTSPVEQISVRILNPNEVSANHPDLDFLDSYSDSKEALLQNSILQGTLTIKGTQVHQPHLLLSDNDTNPLAYLALDAKSISSLDTVRNTPEKINLIWDASRSRAGSNFQLSFDYLQAFFAKTPQVHVQLFLLQNKTTNMGEFQIEEGDWTALKSVLEAIEYDGCSNFNGIEKNSSDLTLIFSDGQFTRYPEANENIEHTQNPIVLLIDKPEETPGSSLRNLVTQSGGQLICLPRTTLDEATERTFRKGFHLMTSQQGIKITPLTSQPSGVYRYLLEGRNLEPEKIYIAIEQEQNRTLELAESKISGKRLEKISSITTLAILEDQGASSSEIIDHCKKHTLVSDYTSLIVLERFQDHLTFRIPPPEKDLLAQYELKIEKMAMKPQRYFTELWRELLRRHHSYYPGLEFILYKGLERIRTVNNAQKKVFTQEYLDPTLIKAFENWEQDSLALIDQARGKGASEELRRQTVDQHLKFSQLNNLEAKPTTPFEVSIRGNVYNPQTFEFNAPTTLKEALRQTKPMDKENLSAVALYRSGKKTIYNTLSNNFEDFALLPGDMIALEYRYFDEPFSDPFASAGSASAAPFSSHSSSDPFSFRSSSDPFSGGLSDWETDYSSHPPVVTEEEIHGPPANQRAPRLLQTLSSAPLETHDPVKQLSTVAMDPISIALQALKLFESGKEQEAERYLSNLRELFPKSTSALRLQSFIQAQIGISPVKNYQHLLTQYPQDHLTTYLLANYLLKNKNKGEAQEVYQSYLQKIEHKSSFLPALILISEYNKLLDNASRIPEQKLLPKDLRIVITNLHPDPTFSLSVKDPAGHETETNEISPTGIAVTEGFGLIEITDRRILLGNYQLHASCERQQLLEIATYRNFGTAEEKLSRDLILVEAGSKNQIISTITVN